MLTPSTFQKDTEAKFKALKAKMEAKLQSSIQEFERSQNERLSIFQEKL